MHFTYFKHNNTLSFGKQYLVTFTALFVYTTTKLHRGPGHIDHYVFLVVPFIPELKITTKYGQIQKWRGGLFIEFG